MKVLLKAAGANAVSITLPISASLFPAAIMTGSLTNRLAPSIRMAAVSFAATPCGMASSNGHGTCRPFDSSLCVASRAF